MKFLDAIGNIEGKRVFLRTGLNVPFDKNGEIGNDFRLRKTLPTINKLEQLGAKVIVVGHIGRDPKESLKPVYEALNRLHPLKWAGGLTGAEVELAITSLGNGQSVMLENVRSDTREEDNDTAFAKELASLADIYVNDAFSDSHRTHASIVGIPALLPSFAGLNVQEEINGIAPALKPQSPSLFMLGGAKFETKQPLVDKFITEYDQVFIAGALANDFFKAKGYNVGTPLVSDIDLSDSPLLSNPKLLLPLDVTVSGPRGNKVKDPAEVESDEKIMDCGPKTVGMLAPLISEAATILWNGPFGNYENGFNEYTKSTAQFVAASGAHSIVGGGDTVASISQLKLEDDISFISTGGGAMLEYLEKGTLPAFEAMR